MPGKFKSAMVEMPCAIAGLSFWQHAANECATRKRAGLDGVIPFASRETAKMSGLPKRYQMEIRFAYLSTMRDDVRTATM